MQKEVAFCGALGHHLCMLAAEEATSYRTYMGLPRP